MSQITALCDKIIELDKKCECIGLCYVQEHWFAEKEFKQYASDHATKLAKAMKVTNQMLEKIYISVESNRERDGTLTFRPSSDSKLAAIALKEIEEIFK